MDKRQAVIRKLQDFRKNVNREMPLYKMILFGSMATGKARKESDIDLLIVSAKFRGLNFFKRAAKMYDYWHLNYPVDFLCYTPQEFRKLSKRVSIVSEAIREGMEIN